MIPSLRTIVRRALEGEARLPKGATALVAVSGGPDSMAMLDVVAKLAATFDLRVHAHGVDHGLRDAATAELDLAEAHAAHLGVPFARSRVVVPAGKNLQARARAARHEALLSRAVDLGAAAIFLAHHADDRAETLLLRLLRGAGPRGLAVLPARAPTSSPSPVSSPSPASPASTSPASASPASASPGIELVRPLLRARKSDVLAYLSCHSIPYATDPSNRDPRFARARVRHELIPLLEELGPGVVRHLEALADRLHDARDGASAPAFPLPRATEIALLRLAEERSPNARVWLPGGLVARIETPPRGAKDAPTPPKEPRARRHGS